MTGFTTRAIHGTPAKPDPYGTLRFPLYDTAAYEFECAEDLQLAFEGKRVAHVYSRSSNPTVADFEQRLRSLTDAAAVIAVSSGAAAITNIIFALAEAGTNIIVSPFLFGNTFSLFQRTFQPWGLEVRFVDLMDPHALSRALNEKTRGVFFEIISNPQLQVVPVREISRLAHSRNVPVILDGTLTTPYLFNSKENGVDIEILSTTKYISGGGTSIGGAIIENGLYDWRQNPKLAPWAEKHGPLALVMALRREIYRNLGSCLSPHNAFLQTLGLETLALRIQRSCGNALAIARFLESHPKVRTVHHPGLESSPYFKIAEAQLPRGCGGLLTFDLKDRASCYQMMDQLKLIRRATNLCDNKTLILHPAGTIYAEFSEEEKSRMGVPDRQMRLSAGIEDCEDLLEDLAQALRIIPD
jgi:O-acetylhomoserine (thiol)-lyase